MGLETIRVGIGQFAVGQGDVLLATGSLGSCVGVVLYDPRNRSGGLAHCLLPDSSQYSRNSMTDGRCVNTALPAMLGQVLRLGGVKRALRAAVVGGASMFEFPGGDDLFSIGKKNVDRAKEFLVNERIPIVFQDVGDNYGRRVEVDLRRGELVVKSVRYGNRGHAL